MREVLIISVGIIGGGAVVALAVLALYYMSNAIVSPQLQSIIDCATKKMKDDIASHPGETNEELFYYYLKECRENSTLKRSFVTNWIVKIMLRNKGISKYYP